MVKKRTPKTLSDQMRASILAAPMTRYAIWKQTGIHESALSRFVNGGSGLSLDNVDKIAELLGWQLVVTREKNNRGTEKEQ